MRTNWRRMLFIFFLAFLIFLSGYAAGELYREYSTTHEQFEDRALKTERNIKKLLEQMKDHEVRIRVLEKTDSRQK